MKIIIELFILWYTNNILFYNKYYIKLYLQKYINFILNFFAHFFLKSALRTFFFKKCIIINLY